MTLTVRRPKADAFKAIVLDAVHAALVSAGRSVKVKRKLLDELMAALSDAGFDPENVMVCFKETGWENWAFAGGRIVHA